MDLQAFLQVIHSKNIEVQCDPQDTSCFAYDAANLESLPGAVVFPKDTQEVSVILEAANRFKVPVTPRGAGTSLAGGTIGIPGGVALNLTQMNQIIEIDEENLTAIVQPGVVTYELHQAVEKLGLFYPPDPGSMKMSTIGGNISVNAGGPHCFKYGVTKDYILGMEIVLADGRIIRFGGKYIKNVSGLDLGSLFIGSEGTLGVVTEATLRLIPMPETKRTILAVYNDLDEAARTVSDIVRNKIVPATLELMDQESMRLIERIRPANLPLDAAAAILIAVDGPASQVEKEMKLVETLCLKNGAREVRVARDDKEQEKLWEGRRSANGAMSQNCKAMVVEDASVPRSKLPDMIRKCKEIAERYHIPCAILGHSGDGNVHPHLLLQELTQEEWERADKAVDEIFRAALDLGGTLTGEHGIGLVKKKYMNWQFSPDTMDLMRSLKNTLDPNQILNRNIML
ncbi:MAG: FAD-binding protein [Desulfitobacterium hafniense]|nr:FAD-binding protein [Desulfitobacterium hafniense]